MSIFDEIHAIREEIRLDYQDYMQAFTVQRDAIFQLQNAVLQLQDALARQEEALGRYQEKTGRVLDRIEQQFLDFDARISNLEKKTS